MLGGLRSPTFILISGMSINKNFKTYFHPFSSNFLLAPISAMTYSPNCILHMIMENGSPVIGQWSTVLKKCSSLERGDLPTSLWMLLMSVQSRLPFHHLEKRSSSWWRNLSAFTFQTSTSVSRVGQSTTFRLFSNP